MIRGIMMGTLKKLWDDDSGATAVEYGLIVGLMAAILVVVISSFGDKLQDLFEAISDKIGEATDNVKKSGGSE